MANAKTQDQLSSCPECGFGPFTRNHFFTGKLMTARDFTDETRFHSERMRHHNSHLHGWGVVCGLKVKAHENAACRDRFVEIEPGTALDCCGNEILVTEAVTVELAQLPAVADLIKKKDTEPHRLQICIHYQECPTEEVPVLYDECGCDETRCAPNRILSSYGVNAILDGDTAPSGPHSPSLKWNAPISPADAKQVVLDSKNKKMYATVSDQNVIYQINTETNMVVGTVSVQALPLNLALSKNGDRLFVVTEPPQAETSTKRQLLVYDTADLSKKSIREVEIPNSDEGSIDLVVAPDDRLFALVGKAGKITSWSNDLKTKGKQVSPATGRKLQRLTLRKDGKQAYAIDSDKSQLVALDVQANGEMEVHKSVNALAAEATPSDVAVVASTGPDLLAVISKTKRNLYLVDADQDKLLGTALLEHPPVAVAVSPGGQYAYVVETEEASRHSYVQAVNLFGIQQGLEQVTATPVQVGDNSQSVVVTPSGDRLYIPYTPIEIGTGGIGIVEVSEQNCAEILWRHLEGCPGCDTANCVILATIENYVAGFKVEDPTDPASDPLEDKEDGIARIDNQTGRQLLPSTGVLLEMVECLLEQGCGDCTGTQGPPGAGAIVESIPPDPTSTTCPRGGAKITDGLGHVAYVCNGAPGANGTPGAPGVGVTVVTEPAGSHCTYGGIKVTDGSGQVTYVCNGRPGTNGRDGQDGAGLEENLTRIKALSWYHDTGNSSILEINCLSNHWHDDSFQETSPGIVIGFTNPVMVCDPQNPGTLEHEINAHHVFQVFIIQKDTDTFKRTQLAGIILPVSYTEGASGLITSADEVSGPEADGVAFLLPPGYSPEQLQEIGGELWVRLQGDFVVDPEGRAIDAEFVRAELETGDRPNGSDVGIQGGQFESWFWINDKSL